MAGQRPGCFLGLLKQPQRSTRLNDEASVENIQLGMYGSKRFNNRWSANGTVSASYLSYETERGTGSGRAQGDADGFGLHGSGRGVVRHRAQ